LVDLLGNSLEKQHIFEQDPEDLRYPVKNLEIGDKKM
jgi:hypothetical protein